MNRLLLRWRTARGRCSRQSSVFLGEAEPAPSSFFVAVEIVRAAHFLCELNKLLLLRWRQHGVARGIARGFNGIFELRCLVEEDVGTPYTWHVAIELGQACFVNDADVLIIELDPLVTDPDDGDVMAVMWPDTDVHNDCEKIVELVRIICIVRGIEKTQLQWEWNAICQLDVL